MVPGCGIALGPTPPLQLLYSRCLSASPVHHFASSAAMACFTDGPSPIQAARDEDHHGQGSLTGLPVRSYEGARIVNHLRELLSPELLYPLIELVSASIPHRRSVCPFDERVFRIWAAPGGIVESIAWSPFCFAIETMALMFRQVLISLRKTAGASWSRMARASLGGSAQTSGGTARRPTCDTRVSLSSGPS
jgi:hypothetical protein